MKGVARLALIVLAVAPGCTCKRSREAAPLAPGAATQAQETSPAGRTVVLDVIRDLDACAFGHRGVLLDFGDPSMRRQLRPGSKSDGDAVEHEGATWLRVRERTLEAGFYWPAIPAAAPDATVYVQARARGGVARSVAVSIDGKPAGDFVLAKAEPAVALARGSTPPSIAPGEHELTLHFVGGPRSSDEPLAELDWVHVGVGDSSEPYAAPTRSEVVVDAAVGQRSVRALSLGAPGFVRCSGWLPADATIEASLALAGGGDAEVQAVLLRDRHAPVVLGTAHVGGEGAWTPWSVPITGVDGDGALSSLELVVERAPKGTRVLIGEPRVVVSAPAPLPAPPPARGVVLVVLGSTAARSLAPWGGPRPTPELARLAQGATTFAANRASSALASSVLASMLTGLAARVHGLDDADARLPRGPVTVEEACRQGGVSTAMFTANPTTAAAFGFDRGWDTFVAHDPLEAVAATQVFDDAAAWIDAHEAERFFAVVDARGAHPPWDATPDDLKSMPPEGYLGVIEPSRAAEAIAKARKHPGRFKEEDRVRAWALHDHAIDVHDAALGRLLSALKAAGRDGDTAVVVTSDVALTDAPPVPFADPDALDEPVLDTPLVVRWPGAPALAGKRVGAPTSPVDLSRTILGAFGLEAPEAFAGVDLAAVARGALVPAERATEASLEDRFAIRWGSLVLLGARDRETRMCDLSLDPACVADVRGTAPLALESLRRWTLRALSASTPAPYPREPAVLDEHAVAALVRWGRLSDEKEAPDDL